MDTCERCGCGELKKEYSFGMSDATVNTYTCGHAEFINEYGDVSWHATYAEAAGKARMTVAMNSAAGKCFC